MPRKAKYHKSRGVKRRVNRSYKPKKYGGYKKFGRFKLQRVFKRMPYRSRFNRKLRVRRKAKGQRLHFRMKISPGDVFSKNSAFTFPFLVHCNPRASNDSFLNLDYTYYNNVADGSHHYARSTNSEKFKDYMYVANCVSGVGLLNYNPMDQSRHMSFNPLKPLRDTYGKVRVNKIVYQYKPVHYDFAKRPMFSRNYTREVNIPTATAGTYPTTNQDGEYNFIDGEIGNTAKYAINGLVSDATVTEHGLTINRGYGANNYDYQVFDNDGATGGGYFDRPIEDKKGYIYIWPEIHDGNALIPGVADELCLCKDIDHIKCHGHCVRKRLDRPFSVSMVPKRYIQTINNPTSIAKYTGEFGDVYAQTGDAVEGVDTITNNGYGNLVNFNSLKLAKKKCWTSNFEGEYHGFRYATCYSKGVYSMGHRPLGLFLHEDGFNVQLPTKGVGHIVNMDAWTVANVRTRNYYSRYFNDYCG